MLKVNFLLIELLLWSEGVSDLKHNAFTLKTLQTSGHEREFENQKFSGFFIVDDEFLQI